MGATMKHIDKKRDGEKVLEVKLKKFKCSINTSATITARTGDEAIMSFLESWIEKA